jgi:hypothetical protein
MSLTNMTRILVRAIESRNCTTAAERENVYGLSRMTLERFFEANASLTELEKARQRRELVVAIEKIEAAFAAGRPVHPSRDLEPHEEDAAPQEAPPTDQPLPLPSPEVAVAREIVRHDAPPAPAEPPRAAPVAPPPAPTLAADPPPPPDRAAPQGEPPAADDPADELFGAAREDDAPADPEPSPRSRRLQRLFGVLLVFLAMLVFGYYHLGEVGERVHRFLVDFQFDPEKEDALKAITPAASTEADLWLSTVRARMATETPANVTTAFHWNEAKGSIETGSAGLITWAARPDPAGAQTGTMVFGDGSPSADLAVTFAPRITGPDDLGFVLIVGFAGDVARTLYSPNLVKIDPTSGRSEDVNATAVRIGLDRAMFGFDTDRRRLADDIAGNGVYRLTFFSETDQRNVYWLRLPAEFAKRLRAP